MYSAVALWLYLLTAAAVSGQEISQPNNVPAGLFMTCPGVTKPVTLSPETVDRLLIVIMKRSGGVVRRRTVSVTAAPAALAADRAINFRTKKTVLYITGYLESSLFASAIGLGEAYAKRGYNVLVADSYEIHLRLAYVVSVRVSRAISDVIAEFLVTLHRTQGLAAEDLELVGLSLGGQMVGLVAKRFQALTGTKVSRVTGLDPAGPCFRDLDGRFKLQPTDAQRVDVIHTNIDGYGTSEPLGHLDYYVNGGEFQSGVNPSLPCLISCSHVRSSIYWWQALEHPRKFIAVQCESVQQARVAKCYNNTVTNTLGFETDFNKTGVFYLPTTNDFPYYMGVKGLRADSHFMTNLFASLNAKENIVV